MFRIHTHKRMPTQAHIESEITFWILTHTHTHTHIYTDKTIH